MKKTKLLALVLAFLMLFSSAGVFAEDTPNETTQISYELSEGVLILRDNIAEVLKDVNDGWTAFDMVAYSELADTTVTMTNSIKQSVINSCIDKAADDIATVSDRACIEIVLSSLGADTTELCAIGESAVINNAELINSADHTASGHYAAPWILLADLQGAVNLTDSQISALIETLSANAGDGTFGYKWDGVTYADADTSGAVLASLARFYGTNDDATALVDLVLSGLGNVIGENGSFGSANSDAMVIIGLIALGENPYEFKNVTSGLSVVDGLLSYKNTQNNGFTFYGVENALATEQGFRALVALSAFAGTAYNIYDFSNATKFPASQTVNENIITLRDNIAEVLKNVDDGWTAFDMVAYSELADTAVTMTDDVKQLVIDDCIDAAASDTATASDRSRIEIVLRSLGIDSTELYVDEISGAINNAQKLKELDLLSTHYSAPWILLADLQGNIGLSSEERSSLIALLEQNSADGTFGYEWEGVQYADPDTAAAVLAALAFVYDTDERAKTLCDEILSSFSSMISENGSFGSANSDAFVIIGLIAMGKNPADMKHQISGASVIDGLLSYVNEANNGFTYYGTENFMATEQGFRALVALSAFDGAAYNIYDFSDNEVVPGRKGDIEGTPDTQEPPIPGEEKITVYFYVKPSTKFWIENMMVEIPEGGTVYDAFCAAIDATEGMSAVGADDGYVTSITKDGTTVSAGRVGSNSGWIYEVNGERPSLGMKDCVLHENDIVLWYYYSKKVSTNTGGSSMGSLTSAPEKPTEPEKSEEPEKPETPVFNDIENHWSKEAVQYVAEKGIMNGVADEEFAPDAKLTRAMVVTMLYRLSGDIAEGENGFSDIKDGVWYYDAAIWAHNANITKGYDDGRFAADDEITREQLVVMLMRYVEFKKMDTSAEETKFKDDDKISDWAKEATNWAKSHDLVSGRDDGTFDPTSSTTRGEIATVFMRFCENILK